MNINLNNYEAYFLDYHEDSLSPALVKELMEFIAQHPELKEEFESFESIMLKDIEEINFIGKESLKKRLTAINSSNFEEYAIEYIEGTLSPILQNELKNFIGQNPSYQKELELFAKTKLTADTRIVFDDKLSLKRRTRRPAAFYFWSAAASIAVIVVSYFMLNKSKAPDGNSVVNNNKPTDTVVKHLVKPVDTTQIIQNNIANIPIVDTMKNLHKNGNESQHKPANSVATFVVKRKKTKINTLSYPIHGNIPVELENYAVTNNGILNMIPATNSGAEKEYTIIEREPEKKKNKLLVLLATLTCKGLHTVTGQHIELEKKFDSDTTAIVAYQLDLGNKKFEFPVKE